MRKCILCSTFFLQIKFLTLFHTIFPIHARNSICKNEWNHLKNDFFNKYFGIWQKHREFMMISKALYSLLILIILYWRTLEFYACIFLDKKAIEHWKEAKHLSMELIWFSFSTKQNANFSSSKFHFSSFPLFPWPHRLIFQIQRMWKSYRLVQQFIDWVSCR